MNRLKSAILGAILAVGLGTPALAQTALTRAQNETNINATIKSNGIGAITGPILNTQLGNLAASMATTLDPNTFSQPQTAGTFIGAFTGHASLDLAVSALGSGVSTLLGGSATGTGGPVGSISPTIRNPNVTDITGSSLPALNVTTANHSAFSVVGAQIIANVDYGSFGDANTTFGFVVGGGKNLDTGATTGSWQLFSARYTGFGGGDGSAFITAGQELMSPTAGSNNNSGRFFGNNPECIIPTAMTPAECTGEEIDIKTLSSPTSDRHGLRIADLGSTGTHATDDSGLSILSSGIGWTTGIEFGSQSGQFPVVAGGQLIETAASSAVLASIMDFSNLTGANPGIMFSVNSGSLYFGGLSWPGGRLKSSTATNGPDIEYGNAFVVINTNGDVNQIAQFGRTSSTIDAPLTVLGSVLSNTPSGGVGYATGAGGAVTQATSKATGVTLNTVTGAITLNAAALAAGAIVNFTLTDTSIAATDTLVLNHISGGTVGAYGLNAGAAAGSAAISVRNATAGSLSEAVVIEFTVVKGATS